MKTHRVTAINTACSHENRIHSDEVGRRHGFRGGLVPGVNVYGYMAVPVIDHYGEEWLDRGWMSLRLRAPCFDGETIVTSTDGNTVSASSESDEMRATGETGLGLRFQLHELPPVAPLPAERPEISESCLRAGMILGGFREALEGISDSAALLSLSNQILVRNFVMPAWVHVSSDVRNHRRATRGDNIEVRGRIAEVFEKKGHQFLTAEVTLLDDQGQLVQTVRHGAIWRLRT